MKAATGAVVTAEELGGAHVHAKQSGLVDHRAKDDAHAIEIARDIFETMVFNEATLADHVEIRYFLSSDKCSCNLKKLKTPCTVSTTLAGLFPWTQATVSTFGC